jgi:hypothetical protein
MESLHTVRTALRDAWSGTQSADRRVAFALAYTAVILALQEYFFIPAAVVRNGWFRSFDAHLHGLTAGLVWVAFTVVFYLIIPAAIVRFGHREPLRTVGYSPDGFARHAGIYVVLFVAMVPFLLIASHRADFARTYPFIVAARGDLHTFIAWEIAYAISFLSLEAFFRGYLLFTCFARMGWLAVFVMVVPYTMIHFHKPWPECAGAIAAGLILGSLALVFRSFWGGVVLHTLIAVTLDILAVHRRGLI